MFWSTIALLAARGLELTIDLRNACGPVVDFVIIIFCNLRKNRVQK
jgi:hypothetical protein